MYLKLYKASTIHKTTYVPVVTVLSPLCKAMSLLFPYHNAKDFKLSIIKDHIRSNYQRIKD